MGRPWIDTGLVTEIAYLEAYHLKKNVFSHNLYIILRKEYFPLKLPIKLTFVSIPFFVQFPFFLFRLTILVNNVEI